MAKMTVQDLFAAGGQVADVAKKFVMASSEFVAVLAENGIELDLGQNSSDMNVNYDSDPLDAYKKSYKPISVTDIVKANKDMAEAIAGEKWVEGFMACVSLVLMFRP